MFVFAAPLKWTFQGGFFYKRTVQIVDSEDRVCLTKDGDATEWNKT